MNKAYTAYPSARTWILTLGILILTVVVYFPGLSGGFIFDDEPNILDNRSVQMESLNVETLGSAANAYKNRFIGRPLATLSLGLDWYFWGNNAFGFKVTNLLLHLINTLLILVLARRLLILPGMAGPSAPWPMWAAFGLAAIWAIHPIQISTVLYVVQRMEIMASTFMLLALLAYLQGRQRQITGLPHGWVWLAGSGLLALASFGAKEIGALFPVFALCLELAVLRFKSASLRETQILKILFASGVALATLAYFTLIVPQYTSENHFSSRTFTWDERLLTQFRVLPMYLGMIALPTPDRLIFYYDAYPHSSGWLSPATTLLGALFLAALLGLAALVHRLAPLATLGILWFFASHLMTSNIIPLELVFEHRNYFALFAVLLTVAALLKLVPADRVRLPAPAIVIVLVCGLGLLGWIRSATWAEPLNLAMTHVEINPKSERARLDLGSIYLAMSDGYPNSLFFQFGRTEFERVAQFEHSTPIAAQALILIDAQLGAGPDPRWENIYLEKLNSRPIDGPYLASFDNLVRQRFDGVPISDELLIQAHAILLQRDGVSPLLHTRFGFLCLEVFDNYPLALAAFERAIELMDSDRESVDGLLESLRQGGHDELAAQLTAGEP